MKSWGVETECSLHSDTLPRPGEASPRTSRNKRLALVGGFTRRQFSKCALEFQANKHSYIPNTLEGAAEASQLASKVLIMRLSEDLPRLTMLTHQTQHSVEICAVSQISY